LGMGGQPLPNALDIYEPLIGALVAKLRADRDDIASQTVTCPLLTLIQEVLSARFIWVWHKGKQPADDPNDWTPVAQSNGVGGDESEYFQSQVVGHVCETDIFSSYSYGTYQRLGDLIYVFVPLISRDHWTFMAIALPQEKMALLGEPLGIILATLYQLDDRALRHPDMAEGAILDALKAAFRFVSPALYDRRFKLFKDRLKRMIVHYQPIVQLEPIKIAAWEALARDPDNDLSTPVDLFHAAELWGIQFTTELDLHFLRFATEHYCEQRRNFSQNRASDHVIPLAVNVYPASLMREVYFEAVREIVNGKNRIFLGKLILEISEKSALPKEPWGSQEPDWMAFRDHLKKYIYQKIKVRFAIDDFGVGHASLSRLLGLKLDYVKIDPDVLKHDRAMAGKALQFVSDVLIEAGHHSSTVILEGVEENCPISLSDLKRQGVSSIQGWIVDRATDRIYDRLTHAQHDVLKQRF
jgi:EAL domain-containing protein (putative c-di-GMP-specific phosphodiesterase class I)